MMVRNNMWMTILERSEEIHRFFTQTLGDTTLNLAEAIDNRGRVVAFEMGPSFPVLAYNTRCHMCHMFIDIL